MGPRIKSVLFLLPMLFGSVIVFPVLAEAPPDCKVPPEFGTSSAHESFETLSSEGAWFAQKQMWHCAESALDRAAHLSPHSWKTFYDLGVIEVKERTYPVAVANLRKASELQPDSEIVRKALAEAFRASGDLPSAETQFRKRVELKPRSVEALDDLAQVLSDEKLYSAAISYWDQALTIEPDNVDIAVSRAQALNINGDTQGSVKSLQELEANHPDSSNIHFSLGTVLGLQMRFAEAEAEFRKAFELDPNDPSVRISLARCLVAEGNYSDVLPLLTQYARAERADPDAHSLLGFAYKGLEQYPQAEEQLRIAVKSKPNDGDLQLALGVTLMHTGRPREAAIHLQKVIELDPSAEAPRLQLALALKAINDQKSSEAMYQQVRQTEQTNLVKNQFAATGKRANELLRTGHADAAEALYRQMLQIVPDDAHTYYNLAIALGMQKRIPDEIAALETAVRLDPKFAEARGALGSEYLSEGRLDDAALQFAKSLEVDPQITESQVNLAAIYEKRGQIPEAKALLQRAVDGNPDNAVVRLNFGLLLAEQGEFDEAKAQVQKAVELDPKNTASLTALAKIRAREGKIEESIALFRKVLALDPQNYLSHLNLGIALVDHLEVDSALEQFYAAVKLNPQSAIAHYNLGRLLLDERNSDAAIPELESACQIDPSLSDALYLLGVAKRQTGDIDRSLLLVQRSIQLAPEQPKALYLLGQDLLSLNREDEAIVAWKRAVQIDPNSTEVLYKLSQILREKDPAEAAHYAELLKARLSESQATSQADTMGNLALAAAERHDYGQAIDQLNRALQTCGNCRERGTLTKDLGLIEARSGDLKSAAKMLQEAAALLPSDPDINTALEIVTRQLGDRK